MFLGPDASLGSRHCRRGKPRSILIPISILTRFLARISMVRFVIRMLIVGAFHFSIKVSPWILLVVAVAIAFVASAHLAGITLATAPHQSIQPARFHAWFGCSFNRGVRPAVPRDPHQVRLVKNSKRRWRWWTLVDRLAHFQLLLI